MHGGEKSEAVGTMCGHGIFVWVELEALLIRVELEVSCKVIGDLCPAPGHPIHSHIPRQEEYEQAILRFF